MNKYPHSIHANSNKLGMKSNARFDNCSATLKSTTAQSINSYNAIIP